MSLWKGRSIGNAHQKTFSEQEMCALLNLLDSNFVVPFFANFLTIFVCKDCSFILADRVTALAVTLCSQRDVVSSTKLLISDHHLLRMDDPPLSSQPTASLFFLRLKLQLNICVFDQLGPSAPLWHHRTFTRSLINRAQCQTI